MKFIFTFILLFLFHTHSFSQTWAQKTDVGGPGRNAPMGFSIGNFGYIGTGLDGAVGGTLTKDLWQYDPVLDTWAQMADLPGNGRFGALGFSIGNKGYCGLGSTGYPTYNFVTDLYEYDPASNSWTQKNNFPGPGRYTVGSFVIGMKGYMGTGWSPYTNDFWEYDPTTDTWLQKANFPGGARQSTVGFAVNGKGYLGTGSNGSSFNDFYQYDPVLNNWIQVANFPGAARYGAVAFILGSTAYVGSGGNGGTYFNDFYRYDAAANAWSPAPSYPNPGTRHSAYFSIGDCGYFGNGITPTSSGTRSFWSFCSCSFVSMSAPTQACLSDSVSFTNSTIGGNSFQWDFGDGSTDTSSAAIVKHVYNSPGTYLVRLIASSACGNDSLSTNINIISINAHLAITDVSCFGGHDGTATVMNAQPDYQYIWMPGLLTSPSLSHLVPGNYSLNITNSANCLGVYYFSIGEPAPLQLSLTSQNAACGGTGSASALVSGGSPPYQYSWNTIPAQNTPIVLGLDAGTYEVQISDSNNCLVSGSVNITADSSFTVLSTTQPAACVASNGSVNLIVSGGSGDFSYDWLPNVSNSNSANNLPAGVYEITVSDNQTGCVQNVVAIVNNSAGITVSIASSSDATCENGEDGTALAVAMGGTPPYHYLWSPGNSTTPSVTNLSPGVHTVVVEDYNDCPAIAYVVIGYEYPSPFLDLGPDTLICQGDSIVLDAGNGLTNYLWNTSDTTSTIHVSTPGTYSVYVTDSNGCENSDAVNVGLITCFSEQPNKRRFSTCESVSVYPNPATDKVEIRLVKSDEKIRNVKLYNSLGMIVYEMNGSEQAQRMEFSLSALPSGVYYITLELMDDSCTRRLIKN